MDGSIDVRQHNTQDIVSDQRLNLVTTTTTYKPQKVSKHKVVKP